MSNILVAGTTYTFRLNNIRNPRSILPTSNFSITSYSSANALNYWDALNISATNPSNIIIDSYSTISSQ
jgi:hypothetical protein